MTDHDHDDWEREVRALRADGILSAAEPSRRKTLDELTPADHAERKEAIRRGEDWQPPELGNDTGLEEMTPEDHARRKYPDERNAA